MARTITEIIKENNDCQSLYDRTIMQIGQLYADYNRTKSEKAKISLNSKFEILIKVEARLRELEKELTNISQ
jgi:phosphoribosyl-dephospho-CoA transferase